MNEEDAATTIYLPVRRKEVSEDFAMLISLFAC
jgi:hypothetical protein